MENYATLTMPAEEAAVMDAVLITAMSRPDSNADYLATLDPDGLRALKKDLTERLAQDFLNLKFINTLI